MTAPTQGKERGAAAAATHGPFPPSSSTLPGAARSARPRAARPSQRGPLLPFLGAASRSRPSEKLAPSPGPDLALAAGPAAPLLACPRGLGCRRTREPSLRAEGGWKEEDRAFPGATAPSWAAPESGDPSRRGGPCARALGPGVLCEPRGSGGAGRRRGSACLGHREVVTLPSRVRRWGRVAGRRALGEGPARKSREGDPRRSGKGKTSEAERPGALPRDPQPVQPRNPEGQPAEGRGLCVRACVRVSACEPVRVQSR